MSRETLVECSWISHVTTFSCVSKQSDGLPVVCFCLMLLVLCGQKETSEHENYAPFSLRSEDDVRFCDPVTLPGVPGVLERALVLQKIKGKSHVSHGHVLWDIEVWVLAITNHHSSLNTALVLVEIFLPTEPKERSCLPTKNKKIDFYLTDASFTHSSWSISGRHLQSQVKRWDACLIPAEKVTEQLLVINTRWCMRWWWWLKGSNTGL